MVIAKNYKNKNDSRRKPVNIRSILVLNLLFFSGLTYGSVVISSGDYAGTTITSGSSGSTLVGSLVNDSSQPGICSINFSCIKQAYDTTSNLAFGKSVVVDSVLSGYDPFHGAENLTDGYYGNGSAWITNTSSGISSLAIDLGELVSVNKIVLGRFRVGTCCDDRYISGLSLSYAVSDLSFASNNASASSYNLAFSSVNSIPDYSGGESLVIDLSNSMSELQLRYLQLSFNPANAAQIAIDEIEVFGNSVLVSTPSNSVFLTLGLLGIYVRFKKGRRQAAKSCSC